MKKIIFLFSSILLFLTYGCNDFIDLSPISSQNENNFYKNEEDMQSAMVAAYNTLYNVWDPEGPVSFYGELMSDNVYSDITAGAIADYEAFDKHIGMNSSNGQVSNQWETYYKSIFIINNIIDKGSALGEAAKQYIAEAKFLRALYYFNMVRAWGDIPLVIKPVSVSESYKIGRTPKDQVYQQIIDDLKDASQTLPEKKNQRFAGAATSDAANTLLGKVYLTTGNKTEATNYLMKEYGKFSLEDNYADLWNLKNKNCKESIFEIQFGNPTSSAQPYSKYWSCFSPLDNRVITVWGSGVNQISADLWNAYEENDPRRDVSIQNGFNTADGTFVPTRFCIKWRDTEAPVEKLTELSRNNFIILRYADVLLMLSEATGDAKYLNEVRDRVGLPHYGTAEYPSQYSNLTEAIAHERQVELGMEFHRWYDLQRLGLAAKVMKDSQKNISSPIYLLPIPQKVIDQNPNVITQNPNY